MHHRKFKVHLHKTASIESDSHDQSARQSLYASCRFMLLFGKLIGLIPYDFGCRPCTYTVQNGGTIARTIGYTIVTLIAAQALVGFQSAVRSKFLNAADYFSRPGMFAFYATGTFMYWHFHHRAHKFQLLFQHWDELKCKLTKPDRTLTRDVTLISGIIMSSAILENFVNSLRFSQSRDYSIDKFGHDLKNETFLKIYYTLNFAQWAEFVPYSWPLTLYAFLSDKLTWYCWNWADVLIVVSSRAMYMQFKSLYGRSVALSHTVQNEGRHQEILFWKQIATDHHALWQLVQEFKEFLSPIIFVSVTMDAYFICLQVHFGLVGATNVTLLDNIYGTWSLVHFLLRVYLICLAGSKVHEWAHKVTLFLHRCPSHAISLDVIRSERYGNHNFIGWTGLDSFQVTNRLLMKLTWVVLTFEIVVLQAVDQTKR